MRTLPRAAAALALLSALTVSGLAAAPAQAAPAASATQATVATSTVPAASKTRITTQPKSVGIRGTQKATFKVKAVGSKLRYQWYVKAPGKKSFKAIKGATKASYTTPKQANKTRSSQYRVVVAGSRGKVTSKSATLKVKAYASTKITTQPKSASIRGKQTATFSVKAAGESLRYQWQVKAAGKKTFVNVKGATKASYTTPKASNTTATSQYRVAVVGKGGTATSSAATLKVTAWAKPTLAKTEIEVEQRAGVKFTVNGKHLVGAEVLISAYDGSSKAVKLVSRTDTSLTFSVTRSDYLDFNRITVKNAAGGAAVDLLLMTRSTPTEHSQFLDFLDQADAAVKGYYGGWIGYVADDVRRAITLAKYNTQRWTVLDDVAFDVVGAGLDVQEGYFDDAVEMDEYFALLDAFDDAVEVMDTWL